MYSDDYTEKELLELEKRLQKIYKQANRELTEKAKDYFKQFEDRYNEEYLKYQAGAISKQEFENWVNTQVGRGKRWEKLRDQMALRLSDTNVLASDYINGVTPRVYAENYNYTAYTLEQTGDNISFTLFDENTVMRLSEGEKKLLPKSKIDIPKDQQWNKKRLQNALLQGILQGESITHLADRLQNVTNMNRNSAIRNARTMVTGAQNGGRQRSYENASKMGLEVQKEWLSANDNRVRDSHAQLNGVRVKYTEKFPNGCKYPGDPSGRPEEVYNCRCTMVAITPHASQKKRTENTVESYKKWKQEKIADKVVYNVKNQAIINFRNIQIPMDLQLFAEKDIKNQSSVSLQRGIRSYKKRIKEHETYLINPESHCEDWDMKSALAQEGLKRHWEKEIKNFKNAIEERIKELKARGDLVE